MSSSTSALRATLATDTGPARGSSLASIAIWLAASALTVLFALLVRDGPLIGGTYAPFGNDSFYHARRILDAAVGSRGFYEFDDGGYRIARVVPLDQFLFSPHVEVVAHLDR